MEFEEENDEDIQKKLMKKKPNVTAVDVQACKLWDVMKDFVLNQKVTQWLLIFRWIYAKTVRHFSGSPSPQPKRKEPN